MDNAFVMSGSQSLGDLYRILRSFTKRERAIAESLSHRLALQEFCYEVGNAILSSHIIDNENVGMIESAGGASLLLEALQAARIG